MDYKKVQIRTLLAFSERLTFPLFLIMKDQKVVQVFREGDLVDEKRLSQYIEKGVKALHYRKEDSRLFVECLLNRFEQKGKDTDLKALRELTIRVMDDIFDQGKVDAGSSKWVKKITQIFAEAFAAKSDSFGEFMDYNLSESYLSQQAVMTMVFAIAISISLGIDDTRVLRVLGMGALLHDIGMSQVSVEAHDLDRQLRPEEWKEVRKHPILGVSALLSATSLNSEVSEIVYQHHERWDGSGYPRGLTGSRISLSARIVAIADSLAAMITPGRGKKRLHWNEALRMIETPGQFDPKLANHVRQQFEISV